MGDDQVRLEVRARPHRFVNGMTVPDGVFEGSAAVVGLLRGPALQVVLHPLDAVGMARRLLGNEGTTKAFGLDQVAGNVAELGREILVDEQHMHDMKILSRCQSKTTEPVNVNHESLKREWTDQYVQVNPERV